MTYWTWWQGGLALSGVAAAYLVLTKRPLGVSGKLARVLAWQEARDLERAAAAADSGALDDAMLEATLKMVEEQMGPEAAAEYRAQAEAERAAACPASEQDPPCADADPKRVPLEVHLAFLIGLFLGGVIAVLGDGSFALRTALDPEFTRLVADGPAGFLALLGGGILVGAGTAMAGGCTSGHGLTGCARMQPGSLAATVSFFGTAALLSAWLAGGFGGAV